MKKLGKFFKTVWNLLIAIPVIILILIAIVLGLVCAVFEVLFKQGRIVAVAFLSGVAQGHQEKKEVETVMQTTMKSKRTH